MVVYNAGGEIALEARITLLSVTGKNKLHNNICINQKPLVKQAKPKYIQLYINHKK